MERSMDSVKMFLSGWLSGVVVGLILSERWRRAAGLRTPEAEAVEGAVGTDAAMKSSAEPARAPTVIVAGAKADAERAVQFFRRAMPFGSTSHRPSAQ
jgi:hypothetical protein